MVVHDINNSKNDRQDYVFSCALYFDVRLIPGSNSPPRASGVQ